MAYFRRGLPQTSCSKHASDDRGFKEWAANACREQPVLSDPAYLDFARKTILKEFRLGWDYTYNSFSESFVPRASARFERFVSASDWWREKCNWKQFQSYLRGKECPVLQGKKLRYKGIESVGKVRKMGIPTCDWDLLGPLHKTMYQYIASKEWVLRGPPTEGRLNRSLKGEWQTSVDLVSATDGLRQDVTQVMLSAALSKASIVPGRIRAMACEYQVPTCRDLEVNHGQNMGTYLSFPLLCLHSFVAAKWATRDVEASILVNGDDTLISCSRRVENSDYPEGYQINEKKTARSKNFAEVNSTQFLRERRGWRKVRCLRRGAYLSGLEAEIHMASVCSQAGTKWQDALARASNLGGFLPSQLGMNLKIPSVYRREIRTKSGRHRTFSSQRKYDSRFDLIESPPTSGDRLAFCVDLFQNGRESGDLVRTVVDAYPYSGKFPLSREPYWLYHRLKELKEVKRVRKQVYCYSQFFNAVEESEFF
jgi:hypothetical protein